MSSQIFSSTRFTTEQKYQSFCNKDIIINRLQSVSASFILPATQVLPLNKPEEPMKTLQKCLIPLLTLAFLSGSAQINIKDKVQRQTTNRVNKRIDQGINKGLDATEEGIKDAFSKKDNETRDKESQNQVKDQPRTGNNDPQQDQKGQSSQDLKAFSQYDFVPGDQLLLYEDFSQDAVGDFPALWTTNKSGEINTLNVAPGNWLNLNATDGNWWFNREIDFPENFIVEFDIVPKKGAPRYAVGLHLYGEKSFVEMSIPYDKSTCGLAVAIAKTGWETDGHKTGQPKIKGNSQLNPVKEEKLNHVILWVQKRRVRIYHEGAKVLDMPTNLYEGSKFTRLSFELYRGASSSSYISNIKITSASPDTRSKLLTEGKLVSYGIYFDVNKDVVKPESYGALKDIAKVLQDNPDVRVKIVGHTDSDGDDAGNLDLSKRRSIAVKKELVATFGIEASRLETDGMGESRPVAANDSPVNKALNRRVEFLKL